MGTMTIELSALEYHANCSVFPLTASRERLITTACSAVVQLDSTPNRIPTSEGPDEPVEVGVDEVRLSTKTPTKNPIVTIPQEMRTRSDGREWRRTKEMATVMGRRRPRATWYIEASTYFKVKLLKLEMEGCRNGSGT